MSMKKLLQGLLGYLLTLLMTLALMAGCLTSLANQLLTDQALHERVAVNPQVISAQMARVEETVNELAETYHFTPETVLNLLPREAFEDYGRGMTAWWMGLLGPDPVAEAPLPDSAAMEDAVREDALFQESTEAFMLRTIARDHVAYQVCVTMQNAVMPIRQSLVSLAAPHLASRNLPEIIGRLPMLRACLFGAAAALFILLLLTQGRNRFLCGSAGLLATFVLLAAMALAVASGLPGLLAEYSPALALQFSLLQAELLPGILLTGGALLIGGLLLMALSLMKRSRA